MAVSVTELPDGAEWSFEVKWDGYRAQAVKNGRSVLLASRNLKDITRQFATVAEAARGLDGKSAVVDGEIVVLDGNGHPSFQALHHSSTSGLSIVYYAFDLLYVNGHDLLRVPLDERRERLRTVIGDSRVLGSDALPGTPSQIAAAVRRLQLEGVIAKRRRSFYEPGRRSHAWKKLRFAKHQELVIGGYKPNAVNFDSLIVGYYEGAALMSAGKVRSGFTPPLRASLLERLRPLVTKRCPFANLPTSRTSHWGEGITAEEMEALVWVKPKLVAEVSFTEWTRDGSLRHAAFLGLRDDKPAREVRRETAASD